jgi:hypothetical protein
MNNENNELSFKIHRLYFLENKYLYLKKEINL